MKLETLKICDLCRSDNISLIDENNNIAKCKNCGYVFDNPRPIWDEIIGYYSQGDKYDSWLEEEEGRNLLWENRLMLVKRYKESGTLLDVGTGIAQFLFFAKNDFKVKGTEISESAIKIAKQKYKIDVIQGEVETIDWDSKFDVITLFHVLEHVSSPSSTINKCKDLLNDEGILIIAVPNDVVGIRPAIIRLLSIFKIGRFRDYGRLGLPRLALDGSQSEIHLSHFKPLVLKKFLERSGFVVLDDTLDRYYTTTGIKRTFHDLFYLSCLVVKKLFRINLYATMCIIAKKTK